MRHNLTKKKRIHIPAYAVLLIMAAFVFFIGIVLPPIVKDHENKLIDSDCKTASTILSATKTALSDVDISQQVTSAGHTTIIWTASGNGGVITSTNGITDLQNKVTALSGNISRKSKTLGTAVWTVTVYPNANSGRGFIINGAWSGAIGADDTYMTKKSGGITAE